jgi:hypothetical protein
MLLDRPIKLPEALLEALARLLIAGLAAVTLVSYHLCYLLLTYSV